MELTAEDIQKLERAIEENALDENQKKVLLALVRKLAAGHFSPKERSVQLRRLRRFFEKKTEKIADANGDTNSPETQTKNHGRLGADDYPNAKVIEVTHALKVGEPCPACQSGKLYLLKPGKVLRIVAQPPIIGNIYQTEKLRCSSCQTITTAPMPPEFGEEKYDAGVKSLIAIYKYGYSIPFFRIQSISQTLGVPLPTSTQWEITEMLWTQVVPVYHELLKIAANWGLFVVDDTGARVLSLMKRKIEFKEKGERSAIYTTGIVAKNGNQEIHLFFTGQKNAGENMDELLAQREPGLDTPFQVSDALSANITKEAATRIIFCLTHGRRNFYDCLEEEPKDCESVIGRIADIYKNENRCKIDKMDADTRLEYHRNNSLPIMADILAMSNSRLDNKEVDPASSLGDAYKYFRKHYDRLIGFCKYPGVPLDTNDVERLLKKSVLHRKNSLFFKTEHGAEVGDCLMSLIQTSIQTKQNPFEYLVALQKNPTSVAKNPQLWLPWNYLNTQKSVAK